MRTRSYIGLLIGANLAFCTASAPAYAQETTTYTYDAKGRVVGVVRSGGPSSGTNTQYQYDKADNRTNVTVSGSANGTGGGTGGGASASTTLYVVVPLNGFSLIVVQQ
jgi:hypothetical protein